MASHRITYSLSARETAVLKLIAWGHSNQAIAKYLGISVKTVEAHRYSAISKLNIRSRVEIVRHAVREGWLRSDLPEFDLTDDAAAPLPEGVTKPMQE